VKIRSLEGFLRLFDNKLKVIMIYMPLGGGN